MKHPNPSIHPRQVGQRGASMIEVLVSLVIFAFGMLGLVGLQNKALGFGQISLYRSQATALSDDILDRMRADRVNAKLGNWNTALADVASSFSGSSVAQKDLFEWKDQVEKMLPSGKGSVSYSVVTGVVTIDIQWNERGTTQDAWVTKSAL